MVIFSDLKFALKSTLRQRSRSQNTRMTFDEIGPVYFVEKSINRKVITKLWTIYNK